MHAAALKGVRESGSVGFFGTVFSVVGFLGSRRGGREIGSQVVGRKSGAEVSLAFSSCVSLLLLQRFESGTKSAKRESSKFFFEEGETLNFFKKGKGEKTKKTRL